MDYSGYLFIVTLINKKPCWGPSCTKPELQTTPSSHSCQDKLGKIRDKNFTENWSLLKHRSVLGHAVIKTETRHNLIISVREAVRNKIKVKGVIH